MSVAVNLALSGELWVLPGAWTWTVCRVIHCLPDDQTDGWRVTLRHGERTAVEVVHRNLDHARAVALEAAAEIYPHEFQGWVNTKRAKTNAS